jgi:glutathione peroxidase
MTEKVSVKGEDAHPFYQWARNTLGDAEAPKWNFHKYLVGPQGEIVASFGSRTTPQSSDVVSAIEEALSTRASN